MPESTITIEVDQQTAQAYSAAREEEQRKIQALLRLRARELAVEKGPNLDQILDEVGRKAKARGLTPEILDSLLREV
jgi:hypothetical protein